MMLTVHESHFGELLILMASCNNYIPTKGFSSNAKLLDEASVYTEFLPDSTTDDLAAIFLSE